MAFGGRYNNVGISRIQLEQDTAKRVGGNLDFTRAGVGLIEIVTDPDFSTSKEAADFCKELCSLLKRYKVSSGFLEDGSMRVDANVSLHSTDGTTIAPRCEIKNINGFKYIESGIDQMIELQERSENSPGGTFFVDQKSGRLTFMRAKASSSEYMYFPDPDYPLLNITKERIDQVIGALREEKTIGLEKHQKLLAEHPQARKVAEVIESKKLDVNLALEWLFSNYSFEQSLPTDFITETIIDFLEGRITSHYAKQLLREEVSADATTTCIDQLIKDAKVVESEYWGKYLKDKKDRHLGALIGFILKKNPTLNPLKVKNALIES